MEPQFPFPNTTSTYGVGASSNCSAQLTRTNENKSSAISQKRENEVRWVGSSPHARWQQRNDGKHVLERVNHRHERHHAHRQRVIVATLEQNFVLHHDERQHLQTRLDT